MEKEDLVKVQLLITRNMLCKIANLFDRVYYLLV